MSSFSLDNKENIDMNGFGQYYNNILHLNDEEPMDIDSSLCINDRNSTLNTSKVNTIRQTSTIVGGIVSNSSPNKMQFQQQQNISSTDNNNDINNSLLSNNNNNNNSTNTAINDDSLVNNKYINATEQVIFDSIFANDSEFQAFLEVLEKKDSDPRINKYSEFARKSLYIQFDPCAQRISSRLSPDKIKRLSYLRENKETIKTIFKLNEIDEEPTQQQQQVSPQIQANNTTTSNNNNNHQKKSQQDALAFIKQYRKQPSIIEKSESLATQLIDISTDPNNKLDGSANIQEQEQQQHLDNIDNNFNDSLSQQQQLLNKSQQQKQQQNEPNDSIIDIEKCKIDFSNSNIQDQSSTNIESEPKLLNNKNNNQNITSNDEESSIQMNKTNDLVNVNDGDLIPSNLLAELKRLKEVEQTQNDKIRYLEDENRKYQKIAVEFENIFQNLIRDNEENESKLKSEILELTKERDHLQEDVIGVEKAFDDLHRRFENLKKKVEDFKKNEEQLTKNAEILKQQIEKEKNKYATLKKHAEEKIELANNEIEKLRKSTQVEIQTLRAELRKAEIKISSLELSVQQKDSENSQLTNLLEDLLSKVKPNSY